MNESDDGVFGYVNEVAFGLLLRMGADCQENQLSGWQCVIPQDSVG